MSTTANEHPLTRCHDCNRPYELGEHKWNRITRSSNSDTQLVQVVCFVCTQKCAPTGQFTESQPYTAKAGAQ